MLPTGTQDTVAQTLKHKTEENHLALEEMLIPKLHFISSTGDYIALLKAFYGYFKPVEKLIDEYINSLILADIQQRRKASNILLDIKSLGGEISELPLAIKLPQINNIYQAFGAMYVLEGSTLGGRGITKMLLRNEKANLKEENIIFFNGYGQETGSRWISFLKSLNNIAKNDEEVSMMVTAANDTFYLFKQWLQIQLVHD